MGGFLKNIVQLGATGAATAVGGPLAGAGVAAGMGMLDSAIKGGTLLDVLGSGAMGAGNAYLGGKLAGTPKAPSPIPPIPSISDFKPNFNLPSVLDGLKFNY